MKRIDIELQSHTYPVYLGRGLLDQAGLLRRYLSPGKTLIVSNDVVAPLYLGRLQTALGDVHAEVHIVADGEQHKTAETWQGILDRLVDMQARRDANLIALGGGVVGDITGFAAASYMRGIRFIQAPTTLLSQVDASVGGKTGINHARGKNLVGAFHQPVAVFIDSATLDTLPAREFNAGLAEVVKYGAIGDAEFFGWLEQHAEDIKGHEPQAIDHLIERSVQNKADIVAEDEKEGGVRALLNYGHTFGHAMESETAYRGFLHGEAVAIGMVTAARLSEQRGLCPAGSAQRLASLLKRFELPVTIPGELDTERLAAAMQLDKKAIASGLRLVLLREIGRAVIDTDSSADQIINAMNESLETAA